MPKAVFDTLKRPLVAAFVGALSTFGFAPYKLWPATLVSVCVLFVLLHRQSWKKAAWIGLAWGLGQFGSGIWWVHVSIDNFGGLPKPASVGLMCLLVGYLALFPALFSGLLNLSSRITPAVRYLLLAPALWLAIDWLRGWLFTGFPWLWIGYSQTEGPLAPLAPILGVEGITLALTMVAGAVTLLLLQRKWWALAVPLVIGGATYWAGQQTWVTPQNDLRTSVALIQGNIPQAVKWLPSQRWPTLMKYFDLTRQNWDADIIVWPEAAVPALEREIPTFLSNLDNAARRNNTALITGILDQNDKGQFFNNVMVLGDNGAKDYTYPGAVVYSKHHLLPFGEFVPFEDLLRPLAPIFNLPMSSFSRGKFEQPNLDAKGHKLSTALCYEIAFSDQVRKNTHKDTDFILTLSNDSWFGRSIGPIQHLEIAQMRALELGKPVIRATNNGVTAVIGSNGRIQASIPQFETAVLRTDVVPTRGLTPYARFGSLPLYIFSGFALLLSLIAACFRRQPQSKAAAEQQ